MPTTASTPRRSSASTSSRVVTPPAAVTRRAVASLTARMAAMSVPCISPSLSTCVYRNSPQYGFERLDRIDRRDRQRRAPAVNHDPAALRVDGRDHPIEPDRVAQRLGEVELDDAAAIGGAAHVEERRADDDRLGAGLEQVLRASDRANAAADAAGETRGHLAHQCIVGADAHRGIEIDQLNFGKLRESARSSRRGRRIRPPASRLARVERPCRL